jgi:endonuclease YncB( thermonuclease family)
MILLRRFLILSCIFILAIWIGLPRLALADFTGKVVGVTDGDTIKVMHHGKAEKIRLSGIDCPEKKQPFGTRAKQFTSQQAFGKEVTIREAGRDRYGRTLADVILPDGRNLNQELLKAGLAWWFRKYSKNVRLGELERQAREAKRGLWVESQPVACCRFRGHPPTRTALSFRTPWDSYNRTSSAAA